MWLERLVFSAIVLVSVYADQDVQLEIPQGILKGLKTETVLHNKPYYSFKGVPYAKPNVGPNKFRMPEPGDSWDGVRDATEHRAPCPFYCMIQKGLIGEEDCLYLNIYTPVLDKEARKAVMVWFHPGVWNSGMASDILFGPDFLIEDDVLVVTVSSRLGALGFLNTGDESAFGNAGMKDQVMALKWVKDNIHFFGGCPNRVTIFGQSSGAASAQYHMLSPMSEVNDQLDAIMWHSSTSWMLSSGSYVGHNSNWKITEGLFSGVIQESGTIINPWAVSYNPRELAFMLGEALGIHTTDSAELVQKLSEFHVKDIIAASDEIMKSQNTLNGRMSAFVPSVEVDLGQDIFLPTDPWTLLKSGKIEDVPVMSGVNSNEAAFFAPLMIDAIELLNTQPELFLPDDLNITGSDEQRQSGECLRRFYFGDKQVSKDDINEYSRMLADIIFVAGELMSLDILKDRISAPIYEYLFSYEAPFGFMKSLFGITDGVAHGDEIGYLFYSNAFKNLPEPGSSAEKMTNVMTKMWTNFAKTRNPTSELDNDLTVNWEPKGKENNYLNINQELKMEKDLMKDTLDYWKNKKYKNVFS